MKYIRVKWKQLNQAYPILLYSELDEQRWEIRKIEVFRDGRQGYASAMESVGSTGLGKTPVPPLIDIASDPQFEPTEITKEEFEGVWRKRLLRYSGNQ